MKAWEIEQREWLIAEAKMDLIRAENKKAMVCVTLGYHEYDGRAKYRRVQAMRRHYDRKIASLRHFLESEGVAA